MMLPLQRPVIDHGQVYALSRERFLDQGYKDRLANGQADVLARGEEYLVRAVASELSEIAAAPDVHPHILAGDMQRLYKEGFLRKNSEARKIYEWLRLSSPYRICPFCLHRTVKTLDHYLPKEQFAAYAVNPDNLVPSCRDCNTEKLSFRPLQKNEMIIHPYFDHIDHVQWLGCDLGVQDGVVTIEFFIKSDTLEQDMVERMTCHMNVLDLFELYDVEASREISETRMQIRNSFLSGGAESVRDFCLETARSRSVLAQNYWRTVLWSAASASEAFCNSEWAI